MTELKPVDFLVVQQFFVDFQKHSKSFEMPPETAQNIGAFEDGEMVGYFIIQTYQDGDVELLQGYLKPAFRHKQLYNEFMTLLEHHCKQDGYKRIMLGTHNRFKSYLKFAGSLGYKPQHLVFSKEI